MNDLPILNEKQNKCLFQWLINGHKPTEAYRSAYDCTNMSDNAVYVEASRFFDNPKIALWIDYYLKNTTESIQEQLNYNALTHFKELEELQTIALKKFRDRQGNPNLSAAIKAVELKGKLAGLYKEAETEGTNQTFNVMGNIVVDGQKLEYEVGEHVNSEGAKDDIASENS